MKEATILNAESITVFFPAYNDAGTIASLVKNALDTLTGLTSDFEVLVVDDGSTDATPIILDELAATLPHFRVIHHQRNQGYGAALRTGFSNASKNLIFYTDGDGQYDVRELRTLCSLLTDGVDVVNGYKIKRADDFYRLIIGKLYNRIARFLFRLPISDVDCDFRLIRRQAMQTLDLTSTSGVICVELVRRLHGAGCIFVETPVHHYPRQYGHSQFFTARRVARTAWDFFVLWLKLVVLPIRMKSRSITQKAVVKYD